MGIFFSLNEDILEYSGNRHYAQFSNNDVNDCNSNFSKRRIKHYIAEGILEGICRV